MGERISALTQLCAEAQQILRLDRVQFWWVGETPHAQAGGFPSLHYAKLAQYLAWLSAAAKPQALGSVSHHPCKATLSTLPEAAGTLSRIEIPLYAKGAKGDLVAVLWLAHCRQKHLWSRQEQLHASHLSRLFELVLA